MSTCKNLVHNCIKHSGRPCDDLKEAILNLVSEGIPLVRALEVHLIEPSDFAQMKALAMEGDEEMLEFAQAIQQEETSFEIELIKIAKKNSSAAGKLLENRFPSRWKAYTESDIERMNPQELKLFIDNMEKKQLLLDITPINKKEG